MKSPLFAGYEAYRRPGQSQWSVGERRDIESGPLNRHIFVCGATGMGKTVFSKGLVEEAIIADIPVIVIDLKGDLASLALHCDFHNEKHLEPLFGKDTGEILREYQDGLKGNRAVESRRELYAKKVEPRLFTPRSAVGRQLALTGFPCFGPARDRVDEEAQQTLVEALIRGFGARMFGTNLKKYQAELKLLEELVCWANKKGEDLRGIQGIRRIQQLVDNPPMDSLGGMDMDEFLPFRRRTDLRRKLASRISGAEKHWYEGEPLAIDTLIGNPQQGKTPLAIIYLGHLTGMEDHSLVVAEICSEIYRWMRSKPGTTGLRALLYIDELGGGGGAQALYPSHPYNPASKPPLSLLIKQGRSAGIGCLMATQNPMDVDLRGLENVATWAIGSLTQENSMKRIEAVLDKIPGGRKRGKEELRNLGQGVFLTLSPSYKDSLWLKERWLYTIHKPLTPQQVETLGQLLHNEPATGVVDPAGTSAGLPNEGRGLPEPNEKTGLISGGKPDETETKALGGSEIADIDGATGHTLDPSVFWEISCGNECWPLEPGKTVLLGRSSTADIQLDDDYVSGRHLEISMVENSLKIRSLNPRNPAKLNGVVIENEAVITFDDVSAELQVGQSTLEFRCFTGNVGSAPL